MRLGIHRCTAMILVAALFVLGITVPASGQSDDEIQILEIEEGGETTSLVIAIPPAIGDIAPVRSNFGLTVDGQVADFTVRPIDEVVDVVIVIDTSGSMRGGAIAAAKSAALTFVEQLPAETEVAVVGFGATAEVASDLGTDRAVTNTAISSLQTRGETALWDSLVLAASILEEKGAEQPYVIVLSDGDDTVSQSTREAAVQNLNGSDVGLYAVAIESPDSNGANLRAAVDSVGGQFFATTDTSTLDGLYRDIANRLASRYVLQFSPSTSNEQTVVVSVAVEGAVATARGTIGSGQAVEAAVVTIAPVINVDPATELGTVNGSELGLLGSSSALALGALCLFGAFFLVASAIVVPSSEISLNSGASKSDRLFALNGRVTRATDRLISENDQDGQVDEFLDAAGINLKAGEFVLLTLLVTVVTGLVGIALGGLFLGFFFAALAFLGAYVYVSARTSRRRNRFADQLTDALGIMTGSLRSGRGLPQAIELVSQEAPSPTDEQFRRIVFETRVGRDLTDSMSATATRMKSQDLEWVTRAVDINRELGGDLTELLDNVANTIRERRRIARHVQALSAEGRMSGWVLLGLPVVMFLFLVWRTPESAALMTQTGPGRIMLGIGLLGMFLGYLWIRKLVDVKY